MSADPSAMSGIATSSARRLRTWLFFGWVLLGGCASSPPIAGQPPPPVTFTESQSAVFGRIAQLRDGKEVDWETGPAMLGPGGHLVYLRSAQTGMFDQKLIGADGRFIWPLAPSDYTIATIRLDNVPRGLARLWATFRIERPGEAVYIGNLRMLASAGRYAFDVEDRLDAEAANIGARVAVPLPPVSRAMVRFEPRVGTFSSLWAICGPRGGVTCDRTWQGLEPLKPVDTARSFVALDNLTPLLEWKPVARETMRYDVAVYESLPLGLNLPGSPRVRGSLVAYAEGLDVPRWRVTPALKPDTKYEWSVRVRDGDTVSTWSTTSQFTLLLVAAVFSHGDWFSLSTPAR